jgi:REP element-mobilizing transposase RayT
MNRKVPVAVDEYYHVYNRGVDRRRIFLNENDYQRFMALLYLCNGTKPVDFREIAREGRTFAGIFERDMGERIVAIGAWCLMPNHFHLLCKETEENGIVTFMQRLSTAYAMYFNIRHERSGSLFESNFKTSHIDSDEYLRYLFAYLYLNPISLIEEEKGWKKKGIDNLKRATTFLSGYDYSSMPKSLRYDPQSNILSASEFPTYFESIAEMERDVFSWLEK